jgi:hypothetical protein
MMAIQWFGQFWWLRGRNAYRHMKLLEKSELQASTTGQAKSTSYFIPLWSTPDFRFNPAYEGQLADCECQNCPKY